MPRQKRTPAPPEFVDVILWDEMDEPAEVTILVDGKPITRKGQMQVISNEEDGDGWKTHWRVQLQSA